MKASCRYLLLCLPVVLEVFLKRTTLARDTSFTSKSYPRIGIIGGGIGGTSCAYFLREIFSSKMSITLFEKDSIGGRLRVMDVDGKEYEAGGSIIHPQNKYMVQFAELLNLTKLQQQSSLFGIYNGEMFVFEESDWWIITMLKFIWHYGFSPFYLFKDVKYLLKDFCRIYDVQQKGNSFTTVDKLLDSMNPVFKEMSQSKLSEFLKQKGYSGKFLDEFVQSVMMVNYGQTNNISALAGYVALAGAESHLWSIDGGNKLVSEGLLKLSAAEVVYGTVSEVELLSDNTFNVKYQTKSSGGTEIKTFDLVILSAPLIKGDCDIRFVNFPTDFHQFERLYHQTVTTFVKGNLNPIPFKQDSVPNNILVNNPDLPFNSIGESFPVSDSTTSTSKKIYKIFSQVKLSTNSVETYLKDVEVVKNKVWLAYPHYKPPEKYVPFVLHPGLFYINAIELSASAMEMSAVAAKNVALLVSDSFKDKIFTNQVKDEL